MQSIHEMTLITFLILLIVLLLHRHGPVKSAQLEIKWYYCSIIHDNKLSNLKRHCWVVNAKNKNCRSQLMSKWGQGSKSSYTQSTTSALFPEGSATVTVIRGIFGANSSALPSKGGAFFNLESLTLLSLCRSLMLEFSSKLNGDVCGAERGC